MYFRSSPLVIFISSFYEPLISSFDTQVNIALRGSSWAAINSCCSYNLMHDCCAYLLLNSAVQLCPDTSLTFPLQVSKRGCLPAVNIKSILLQRLRGCKASSLQSRAHSIPDKGSAFITWCSESQMRVWPCSAIYHPRSASSHRGRKDLGCVYAPPPPRHLFLKSTRFSVTTLGCILCWENKHGGFADALWGSWLVQTFCILCKILAPR